MEERDESCSGALRAGHGGPNRVKGFASGDEQCFAVRPTEGEVRRRVVQEHLSNQFAVRRVNTHPFGRGGPQPPGRIAAHACGHARDDLGKHLAVGRQAVWADIKDTNAAGFARIGDVELFLVG